MTSLLFCFQSGQSVVVTFLRDLKILPRVGLQPMMQHALDHSILMSVECNEPLRDKPWSASETNLGITLSFWESTERNRIFITRDTGTSRNWSKVLFEFCVKPVQVVSYKKKLKQTFVWIWCGCSASFIQVKNEQFCLNLVWMQCKLFHTTTSRNWSKVMFEFGVNAVQACYCHCEDSKCCFSVLRKLDRNLMSHWALNMKS